MEELKTFDYDPLKRMLVRDNAAYRLRPTDNRIVWSLAHNPPLTWQEVAKSLESSPFDLFEYATLRTKLSQFRKLVEDPDFITCENTRYHFGPNVHLRISFAEKYGFVDYGNLYVHEHTQGDVSQSILIDPVQCIIRPLPDKPSHSVPVPYMEMLTLFTLGLMHGNEVPTYDIARLVNAINTPPNGVTLANERTVNWHDGNVTSSVYRLNGIVRPHFEVVRGKRGYMLSAEKVVVGAEKRRVVFDR